MVFVREGNQGTWYLNGAAGEKLELASGDPVVAATSNFRIGNWVLGGREYNGMVDEVFIFNRALSEDEVTSIMNVGLMGEPSSTSPAGKTAAVWGRIKTRY
jgi:hypothetical protein